MGVKCIYDRTKNLLSAPAIHASVPHYPGAGVSLANEMILEIGSTLRSFQVVCLCQVVCIGCIQIAMFSLNFIFLNKSIKTVKGLNHTCNRF